MLWHYTTHRHVRDILRDGILRTNKAPRPKWGAVWFSANPVHEPSAAQSRIRLFVPGGGEVQIFLTPHLADKAGMPYFRFGVVPEVAPYTLNGWCNACGVTKAFRAELLRRAAVVGADKAQWFCSLVPVKTDKWAAAEVYHQGHWQPFTPADLDALINPKP
jgi:hypothetical protein